MQCTQLLSDLDRVIPINHSCRQKTAGTALPGEDCILLDSLVLTCYPVTDRRTDELTDVYTARSIYNACKASFVVRLLNTGPPLQG